jgi:hypothetical protein
VRFGSLRGALWRCGERVDDLTSARVMEFFTRLMLYRGGIVLQLVNVVAEVTVLLLQLLRLDLQLASFLTFVGESGESVMTKDDAIPHHDRQYTCTEGRHLAA